MLSVMFLLVGSLLLNKNSVFKFYWVMVVLLVFLIFNYSSWKVISSWKLYNLELGQFEFYFVLLTLILFIFIFKMYGNNVGFLNLKVFQLLSVSLCLTIVFFFFSVKWFSFYVFFELSLLLLVFFIMNWGVNPERLKAVVYFLMYTFVGSLPLFMNMMVSSNVYFSSCGSFNYVHYVHCMWFEFLSMKVYWMQVLVFLTWVMAFFMKLPVYGFHLWLPKAHVEAPVFGSMLLAGIMLKLGVFGFLRYYSMNTTGLYGFMVFFSLYFCVSLLILSLLCVRNKDLKAFVAYSSIVHMSLIVMSLWCESWLIFLGSVFLSFSHGICSSGLFLGVQFNYSIASSRSFKMNRGVLSVYKVFMFMWLSLCVCNCSFPWSLKLMSELMLVFSGMKYSLNYKFILLLNVFFCGLYCMFLYYFVAGGKVVMMKNCWNYNKNSLSIYLFILFMHFYVVYGYMIFSNGLYV